MNQKFKFTEKTVNTLLYVGAGVLIVAILSLSIFAFAQRKDKTGEPITTAALTTKAPVTTEKPAVTTPVTTAKPEADDKPTATTPTYVNPLEGALGKDYDAEVLVYSVTMNDYRVHLGVDIAADLGSAVYAMAEGKIVSVAEDYLMGTTVKIEHAGGIVSVYAGLDETLPDGITVGAEVEAGQLIGGVGESAIIEQCDDAHLHFEVLKDGKNVDPLDYISVTALENEENS